MRYLAVFLFILGAFFLGGPGYVGALVCLFAALMTLGTAILDKLEELTCVR